MIANQMDLMSHLKLKPFLFDDSSASNLFIINKKENTLIKISRE